MCIGFGGYHALSSIENKGDVWAILFPLSKLAKFSVYLLENNNQRLSLAMEILLSEANLYGIKRKYNPIVIL